MASHTYGPRLASQIKYTLDENIQHHIHCYTDTPAQTFLPLIDLIDSSINDAVINVVPFLK